MNARVASLPERFIAWHTDRFDQRCIDFRCMLAASAIRRILGDNMNGPYGQVLHPETGKQLAWVEDGKMTTRDGETYDLIGDMIVDANGTELGYLSPFIGLSKGSSDLANKLLGRGPK
jgi:hypothetical protein